MTDISSYYANLSEKCNDILTESFLLGRDTTVAPSHAFIFDYTNWLEILEERFEHSIYKMAIREYQTALLSNTIGLYNQAFLGLRFFFERTLVAVLFSANEMDLRLWHRGERDTYWQEIIDENNGIFSNKFCRAFFPELKDERIHFQRIAQKVYRECSEYVHGNLGVQSKIPESLGFDEFLFNEWHAKADVMKRVISFCFCLRYLPQLNRDKLRLIESNTLDQLGHISGIRELFSSGKN